MSEVIRGEPITDLSEDECREIAQILHRKYSMFNGSTPGGEKDFHTGIENMMGIVADVWLITTGRWPIEAWRDPE